MKGDAGSPINDDALAAFGLVHAGPKPDNAIEVWPENLKTVEVFIAMGTQWSRAGMNGVATGFRYEALPIVMRYCSVPAADRPGIFAGLRHMEIAALEEMNGG